MSPYTNRRVELDQSKESSVREFEQLARYIVKPHFSLEAIRYVSETKTVLYKGTMHAGIINGTMTSIPKHAARNDRSGSQGMKASTLAHLTDRRNLLILTYAPAGLGHLRITDALYDGLPKPVNPVVLGSQDKSIETLHRITSIHPIGRTIFDWLQTGPLALQANRLYRYSLRMNTGVVYNEMIQLIEERLDPPKKILVVSTHFGLAHKLAVIKERLQKEKGVRIVLVVFVSDDTFQQIWYVDGADLLAVTSNFIKRKYAAYGHSLGQDVRIEVVSYPLNPQLGIPLSARKITDRRNQLDAKHKTPIRVSIPISGAAVGTLYVSHLIASLREKSDRFHFHIVSKDAPFTHSFLTDLEGKPYLSLSVGKQDREVVDLYDDLLNREVISLEVTKPSEQAFKALTGTQTRGGVILLFAEPVGSQESDNLDFLERHKLIPTKADNASLWNIAGSSAGLKTPLGKRLFEESRAWRGVRLPGGSKRSADFIWWILNSGLFARMESNNRTIHLTDEGKPINGSKGVSEFWDLATSI